jgi:uncharacterized coiled-coil protein SlyX
MPGDQREIALLRILIASGEKAIETLRLSANHFDQDFLADLERTIARSRDELTALTERVAEPS